MKFYNIIFSGIIFLTTIVFGKGVSNDKFTGFRPSYFPPSDEYIFLEKAPTMWDWRDHGIVGPIKNQEQCGSCWAFSAVGALESQLTKATNVLTVLSEQNMIDCVKNISSPDEQTTCCDGCMGGEMYAVYQYLLRNQNGKDDTETQYPYMAINQNCMAMLSNVSLSLKKYVSLPVNETIIKLALYEQGPISVGVNANQNWKLYTTGIYNPTKETCNPDIMDHGVILVGYGTERGLDYWIVRNSWGENWGENGYMRLRRGKNSCGVANIAIYPVLQSYSSSLLFGSYCGSLPGLVNNMILTLYSNNTLSLSAKIFGKNLSCLQESYSYNSTTTIITLTSSKCIVTYLNKFGIPVSSLKMTYENDSVKINIAGESIVLKYCKR